MSVIKRNNVKLVGNGKQSMILAHGFGCDQNMWRFITPAFADEYKVVLFDHVGNGLSDTTAYDPAKYSSLEGYADDILEICAELDIRQSVFVGHSVSAMMGILAAIKDPSSFAHLILVGPSPCYINDLAYEGGFERHEIDELIETLDSNYLGWSKTMAPVIMGNPDRPQLAEELTNSFCRTDPKIARAFARVTFLSDNRSELKSVRTPSLILQCSNDVIASKAVGCYVHSQIAQSSIAFMKATGHCPNLSAPEETIACIKGYLDRYRR